MFQFAQSICVFALPVFALPIAGLYAQTEISPPLQITFTSGIAGIAEGQTAQLNALNPGVAPPAATGMICSGLLAFVGSDGKVLKSTTVNVAPGTSQPIALDSIKDLPLAVNERKEIRATITIPPVPPPSGSTTPPVRPVCNLIGTLEIFNTIDGHTQVTLGTVHQVPSPVVPVPTSGN
jgi:hypothetical protein